MDESSVVPLRLSRRAAAKIIKKIAVDSDRIVAVPHAIKRMIQRQITITQARTIVRIGYIDGAPWFDEHGMWRVTMRGRDAGDDLTVGLAIEWKTRLLIITVF